MNKKNIKNTILNVTTLTIFYIGFSYLYKAITFRNKLNIEGIEKYMTNIIYFTICLSFILLGMTLVIYKKIYNIRVKKDLKNQISIDFKGSN